MSAHWEAYYHLWLENAPQRYGLRPVGRAARKKCISMNEMFLHVSDHAGWWLQGAEGPGCQKTHPEDDGWEGKTFFVSNAKKSVHCMIYVRYLPIMILSLYWSIIGRGHDLHGARKTGHVAFSWWVCGRSVWSVVSAKEYAIKPEVCSSVTGRNYLIWSEAAWLCCKKREMEMLFLLNGFTLET